MNKLKPLTSGLLFAAILSIPVHAQKISDLETIEEPLTDGQPAAGQSGASQPTATQSGANQREVNQIGDWGVICDGEGASGCAMTQLGKDPQGSPAIEFVVRKVDQEGAEIDGVKVAAVADIITPLGVLLEFGLRLKIDDGEERGAPFRICQQHGCLVREPLSTDVIANLKRGNSALVTVAAEGAGPIDINISLRGFTKAFDSL